MSDFHKPVHAPIPGLGLRSIKTALAVSLTAFLYAFTTRNPTFACIGAVFGLGSDMENSWLNGGNRLIGTIVGGFIGLAMFWVEHQLFPEGNYWFSLLTAFIGVILLVTLVVKFKWPGAVQPGGVVLCIILFNTPPDHITYALDRMFDTGVGVVIALALNLLLTRDRLERWFHLTPAAETEENE